MIHDALRNLPPGPWRAYADLPLPVFVLVNLLNVAVLIWWVRCRVSYIRTFPKLDRATVRFRESRASGRSLANILTRLGGARNCLEVIVVGNELWVRLAMPFRLLFTGGEYDLAHRVPLANVESVEDVSDFPFGRALRLRFGDDSGRQHAVDLVLRHPDAFKRALHSEA